jgi:hypothetical protein
MTTTSGIKAGDRSEVKLHQQSGLTRKEHDVGACFAQIGL